MRKFFVVAWNIISTALGLGALGIVLYFIWIFFQTLYNIIVQLGWI